MPDIIHGAFEWDSNKNEYNFHKHGIWFEEAIAIFRGFYIERDIFHAASNELRHYAIGLIRSKEFVVIYTMRSERRRIISARRAHDNERKLS